MKEIVIISGKGGTGKTSLTSAFASLAQKPTLADCDVDAADLYLTMTPTDSESHVFISGHEAVIDQDKCVSCGRCEALCRFDAISHQGADYRVSPHACEGCKVCVEFCPVGAISFPDRVCGNWFSSETRFGKMVHAKLGIAAENSGKLVSLVRQEAKRIATAEESDFLIIDGPPGTGCPVIASITGADAVVIVTEPSLSGIHDLERVIKLSNFFKIPFFVCINKYDINLENSKMVETYTQEHGGRVIGRIPYSKEITDAQIQSKTIIETGHHDLKKIFKETWNRLTNYLITNKNQKV